VNIYEVVTNESITHYDEVEVTDVYEVTGFHTRKGTRQELYGEYKLAGLNGPMYGGVKDGKTVIRYETPAHYATYD
jgi:hypothetical protein